MKAKKYLTIMAIIIIISGYFIYPLLTHSGNIKPDDKTVKLKLGTISNLFKVNGTLLPVKIVDVQSPLTGEIINLKINEGDSVVKNQILAEIKPDPKVLMDLMQKENSLLKKKLEFEKNKKLYDDNLNLIKQKMITEEEFNQIEMDFIFKEKDYKLAQMEFDLFIKENGFDFKSSDEMMHKNSYLRSPINGIVLENFANTGMFVKSAYSQYSDGTIICSIGDLSEYVINFSVNEMDYNKLHLNGVAEVKIPGDFKLKDYGKITQISPIANYKVTPVTFDAQLTFKPAAPKNYFPGMTVELAIIIEEKENILTLPIESILASKKVSNVVIKGINGPELRKIKTGISNNNLVEIISGIENNEEVYLNPKTNIREIVKRKK
jgi:HlyD family secretion protein